MWDFVPVPDLSDWRILALLVAIGVLLLVAAGFLVIAFLLRMKNVRKAANWSRREAAWDPVVEEVLGGRRPPHDLAALVEPGDELYFVDYLYRVAKKHENGTGEVLRELARPHLGRIAERTRGGDAERRARAVHTISVLAFDDHVDHILEALDDPSPLVSMTAARALSYSGGAEYTRPVVERLHRFEDWSPRFLTAMLAALGPAAAGPLRELLANAEQSSRVRAVSADALGQIRDSDSADVAARIVMDESDSEVLAACLRLLRRVGRLEHLPAIRAKCDSPDKAVRAQAFGALGRLGTPADTERLRAALDDESPWVALNAARALRRNGQSYTLRNAAAAEHVHSGLILQVLAE